MDVGEEAETAEAKESAEGKEAENAEDREYGRRLAERAREYGRRRRRRTESTGGRLFLVLERQYFDVMVTGEKTVECREKKATGTGY